MEGTMEQPSNPAAGGGRNTGRQTNKNTNKVAPPLPSLIEWKSGGCGGDGNDTARLDLLECVGCSSGSAWGCRTVACFGAWTGLRNDPAVWVELWYYGLPFIGSIVVVRHIRCLTRLHDKHLKHGSRLTKYIFYNEQGNGTSPQRFSVLALMNVNSLHIKDPKSPNKDMNSTKINLHVLYINTISRRWVRICSLVW